MFFFYLLQRYFLYSRFPRGSDQSDQFASHDLSGPKPPAVDRAGDDSEGHQNSLAETADSGLAKRKDFPDGT